MYLSDEQKEKVRRFLSEPWEHGSPKPPEPSAEYLRDAANFRRIQLNRQLQQAQIAADLAKGPLWSQLYE